MNLLVLGATGRTGRLVVERALAAGHNVTALVRSLEKLTMSNSNLRVVAGQATNTSDISRALEGADADAARVRALAAYKTFLDLWKNAEPGIPIYKEAKAEHAKLLSP